jgi:hypothetical protein
MSRTLDLIAYTHVAIPVARHNLACVHLPDPLLLDTTKLVTVEPFSVPDFTLVRGGDVRVDPDTSWVAWPKRLY